MVFYFTAQGQALSQIFMWKVVLQSCGFHITGIISYRFSGDQVQDEETDNEEYGTSIAVYSGYSEFISSYRIAI